MELKYASGMFTYQNAKGFNRTFMELKSHCTVYAQYPHRVLIVPLWN